MRSLFICFCLVAAASCFGAEIKIDFADYAAGQMPSDFHSALAGGGKPGEWKIVMDAVPPLLAPLTDKSPAITSRGVLAQTSEDPTDERFPMLIYDGQKFGDFRFATRFKIVSGATEQMAGLVFRFQNESNFYVLRVSALGQNLRFYKVVNGVRSDPIGPPMQISSGVWHTLAVQCQGNQIVSWYDGVLAMPVLNDNTFTVGKIGFWTKSDAVSYFADPVIDYKPLIPVAQTLVQNIMEQQPRILELRIYALNDQGQPRIIGSKDKNEIGQPGTDAEKDAITDGKIFFGRGDGTVAITMPFRDHNGDPVAAVHVQLKSSFFESQDTALSRATAIVKLMQAQIPTAKDLME